MTTIDTDNYYDQARHIAEAQVTRCEGCRAEIEYFQEDDLEECEVCEGVFCEDCLEDGVCAGCRE